MTAPSDPVAEFTRRRPQYEEFCQRLSRLIKDLLASRAIEVHLIEHRAKTVDGFAEKLQRSGKSYANPLTDIKDLAGVRVILHYVDDVDRVSQLVDDEFTVDPKHSVDKR